MWTYLKGHPDIFMPGKKELYFFDSDLWGRPEWAPTLEDYLKNFSGATVQKKTGEATPSYLRSHAAPFAIKSFCPDAQIIIMLRNPIDVMHSLHRMALFDMEPFSDFESALKADAVRTGRKQVGYWEFADFPDQVQKYFDLFGRENVFITIYDDLAEHSAMVCGEILRFLNVRTNYAAAFPWIHRNKELRNPRIGWMLARPPGLIRLLGRTLVPQRFRSRIRMKISKAGRVVRPRALLGEELRRRLQKKIEPRVERLSVMLGRDLSAWCSEAPRELMGPAPPQS